MVLEREKWSRLMIESELVLDEEQQTSGGWKALRESFA